MMSSRNHYTGDQLLLLIKDGDKSAFTAFCEMYREFLLLIAFKRLNDADEAQDIVQEICIWIWVNRSKIDVSQGVKAYLWGAVSNKTSDLIRSKVRQRERHQQYMCLREMIIDSNHIERKELGHELNTAILMVSPASREAFIKCYLEDKSLKEIATEMNINVQSVKNHIHRALKLLRKNLQKK